MISESQGAALLKKKKADSQALPQIPGVRIPRDEASRFTILKTVTSSPEGSKCTSQAWGVLGKASASTGGFAGGSDSKDAGDPGLIPGS